MSETRQITLNSTKQTSQDDCIAQSGKVALTMGALSVILLLITSFLLSTFHHFLS